MKKNIRINNIPFENAIVSEEGSNIIYAKSCKEEFFGVYNINLGDRGILCESNSPRKVYCEIIIDGKLYENIPFVVVKSQTPKIIINKRDINQNMLDEKTLYKELMILKKELRNSLKNNSILTESLKTNQKEELLNEFLNIANQNEIFIENKLAVLENDLEGRIENYLNENISEALSVFNEKNSNYLQKITEKLCNEFTESNKTDFDSLKISLNNEIINIQKEYENKLSDNISYFSEENKKVLEEIYNSRKNAVEILSESIEKAKIKLQESFKNILETQKKEFNTKIISEFKDSSKEVIEESNKKIKDLEKKIENLSNQLNKSNSEKKRMESLLQDARKYTDGKVNQILEESKKYTRIMMDMVGGGGGGSVAVQYAGGGTINGDLNVSGNLSAGSTTITLSSANISGDLTVDGTLNATTILSGGEDLTEIFAGEGEGDDNPLDGGLI